MNIKRVVQVIFKDDLDNYMYQMQIMQNGWVSVSASSYIHHGFMFVQILNKFIEVHFCLDTDRHRTPDIEDPYCSGFSVR